MSALDTQVGGNHYRHGTIQPVQYIEANKLQYLEASVVKRCTRHDKPTGKGRQDIEKAIHELQLLLELRYPASKPVAPDNEQPRKSPDLSRGLASACLVCGELGGHGSLSCPKAVPKAEFIYAGG